jgi:serine/threonine protein phosphatase PrpC
MITISSQGFISELGKRNNNEDNYGLNKGLTYVVCDCVGGAEKGEVASEITVRCFVEAFKENVHADANDVLKQAEDQLSSYLTENPEAIGMATTLTFSQVRDNGIYVAWVGDSRIYQFRKGNIVFKTEDHSWVNEALKAGIINEEEAINHPKSNIITRAVQGSHKPTSADTKLLHDIQKGDLFFHCSDGVLESWDDESLQALFSSQSDPQTILEILKNECFQYSKDNFTAIVYRIENAGITSQQQRADLPTNLIEAIPLSRSEFIGNETKPSLKGAMKVKVLGVPLFIFFLLIIPILIYFSFFKAKKPQVKAPTKTEQTVKKDSSKLTTSLAIVVKYNHDSLTQAGWDSVIPPILKELQINKHDVLQKMSSEKDANKTAQYKKDLKICEDKIDALKVDTTIINHKLYYKIRGTSNNN